MSIENTLERIAEALEKIAAGKYQPVQTTIPVAPIAEVKKPLEVVIPTLIPQPPAPTLVAPAPVAVPAPVVAVPAAVSPSSCPINNGKELMEFVMSAYRTLGPEKGARIQEVLSSIGCAAINEVRPDQYAALYAGVEALKA